MGRGDGVDRNNNEHYVVYNGVSASTPTSNIDISSIFDRVTFIDISNNCEISNSDIVSVNTTGITISQNGITRFIPSEQLKVGIVTTANGDLVNSIRNYTIGVNQPSVNLINNYYTGRTPTFSSNLNTITKYGYFFGIDKVNIKYRKFNNTCSSISQKINISPNGYLQLEADYYEDNNSSVEFYIIDDNKEIPIVPSNIKYINNEKIFPNLNTRFKIKDNYIIKKDGEIINITLEEAKKLAKENIYTISYTPIDDSYQYSTKNTYINIKIILRKYKEDSAPPYVENVLVKRYGGSLTWIK